MQKLGFLDVNINTEMETKITNLQNQSNFETKKKNVLSIPFQISFRVQSKSLF